MMNSIGSPNMCEDLILYNALAYDRPPYHSDYRTIEVFRIDKEHLGAITLYSRREKQDAFPIAQYTAIQGDFLAILYVSESHTRPRRSSLIVVDFVADRIVFAEVPYVSGQSLCASLLFILTYLNSRATSYQGSQSFESTFSSPPHT